MEKITFEYLLENFRNQSDIADKLQISRYLLENFRNQSDIADKLQISRQAVSKWFINKQIPKLRQYEIQEYLTKTV